MLQRVSAAFVVTLLLSTSYSLAQKTYDPSSYCTQYILNDIELLPGLLPKLTVYTWLCQKNNVNGNSGAGVPATSRQTLIIPHSGGTYGSIYNDFPYQRYNYSFVEYMVNSGYAVLNYDRVGIGLTDKPFVSTVINCPTEAFVASQIIDKLHAGLIGGIRFPKVVSYCHSLGCPIAIEEAATYQNVQGLIITGFAGIPVATVPNLLLGAKMLPVQVDPDPRLNTRPLGYLTTTPEMTTGGRTIAFYYLPNTDPTVVMLDEATKETITDGEIGTAFVVYAPMARLVSVPVLEMVGRFDAGICTFNDCANPLASVHLDPLYWGARNCFELHLIENSGHDLHLHKSARTAYGTAVNWLNRRIGTNAQGISPGCGLIL